MTDDDLDYVHVWAGYFSGDEQDFTDLFDLSSFYETGDDLCAFSEFVGHTHHEDIFGAMFSADQPIDFSQAIVDAPQQLKAAVEKTCSGPTNALVCYGCFFLKAPPEGEFRGLSYIGRFLSV